jgi:predicted DNA-binding transcriptional regulator AlpA
MQQQLESPLMKVSEASQSILGEKPSTTYEKIRQGVFPAGVVVQLGGERSFRFHRENLLEWLAEGGSRKPAKQDESASEDRAA